MQTATTDSSRNRRKRVFTDEDEILILKSLADINSKIGNGTYKHYNAFYNSIKDSLTFKPTQSQFRQRIWKLKKKFDMKKKKKVGTFTTAHESELFQLSDMLWGEDNEQENGKMPKKKRVVLKELESVVVDNKKKQVVSEELESVVVDKDKMALRELLRLNKMHMGHLNVLLKRKMELICMGDVNVLKRKMKLIVERFELAKESVDSMFEGLEE